VIFPLSRSIEAILQAPVNEKPTPRPSKKAAPKPSPADSVAQFAQEHPESAELLRRLHIRWENRTFLPELRDVKRFLEEHDRPISGLKSRAETLPKVLRLLAELGVSELEALCHAQPDSGTQVERLPAPK
jgi:hypothetical protein